MGNRKRKVRGLKSHLERLNKYVIVKLHKYFLILLF